MTQLFYCAKISVSNEREVKKIDRKEEVNAICHSTRSIRSILAGVDFTAKDFIDTQLFDDDITKQHILDDLLLAQTELVELRNFVSKMKV